MLTDRLILQALFVSGHHLQRSVRLLILQTVSLISSYHRHDSDYLHRTVGRVHLWMQEEDLNFYHKGMNLICYLYTILLHKREPVFHGSHIFLTTGSKDTAVRTSNKDSNFSKSSSIHPKTYTPIIKIQAL